MLNVTDLKVGYKTVIPTVISPVDHCNLKTHVCLCVRMSVGNS